MNTGSKSSIANLLVLLALAGAGWALLQGPASPAPAAGGRFDLLTERKKLDRIIAMNGLEAAYAHFKDGYAWADPVALHSLGHYIGEEIYERQGLEGVRICDGSYSFGCYHGVFASSFSEEGEEAVPRAADICAEFGAGPLMGSCVHGVGHGIMGLRSYDITGLRGALGSCDRLASELRHECWHGAFMEYNRRTPMAVSKSPMREFDPAKPLSPCDEVEPRYRTACYVEQTAWWSMAIELPNRLGIVEKVSELCGTVPPGEERRACWNGIGLMLPLGGEDPVATIRRFCLPLLPLEAAESCFTSGLRLMAAYGRPVPLEACDALPASSARACRKNLADFLCAQGNCPR